MRQIYIYCLYDSSSQSVLIASWKASLKYYQNKDRTAPSKREDNGSVLKYNLDL